MATTFTIAAAADNGRTSKTGLTYPPSSNLVADNAISIDKELAGLDYNIVDGLLGWDTSSLDDTLTTASVDLKILIKTSHADADNRSLVAEWYDWGATVGFDDYAENVGTTAGTWDLTGLTYNAVNTLTLSSPSSVNRSGWTRLRLGISGGQPAGGNYIFVNSYTDGTPAQLVVTDGPPAATTPPARMGLSGLSGLSGRAS